MWLARLLKILVGLVVVGGTAVVAVDSFKAHAEDPNRNDSPDPDPGLTPAELEMRHVKLNEAFTIAHRGEVLISDDENHLIVSFVTVYDQRGFHRTQKDGIGDFAFEFVLSCKKFQRTITLTTSAPQREDIGTGYSFSLLEVDPSPWVLAIKDNLNICEARLRVSRF